MDAKTLVDRIPLAELLPNRHLVTPAMCEQIIEHGEHQSVCGMTEDEFRDWFNALSDRVAGLRSSRRERRRDFSHASGGRAPVSSPADDARHNGRGSLAEAFDAL